MRVKIYGIDESNRTVPVLTDASGKMNVTGTVTTSGSVAISGPVNISGTVAVSGPVAVSGSVYVSGSTVGVSGSVAISGPVEISGTVAVSGPVAVSGNVYVSGSTVGVSGSVAISGPVEISETVGVFLSGREALDSGPLMDRTSGLDSGPLSGVWDVLGYNSWTLAVKYSGLSGEQVAVKLQMAVVSGDDNWVDDGDYVAFSGTNAYWIFRTPTYHVRYARLYAVNTSDTASGDFLIYMQAEY